MEINLITFRCFVNILFRYLSFQVFTSSSLSNEIKSNKIIYRTKVIQGSLAPEFHEIFAFPITEEELENTNVICQVNKYIL